MLSSQSNNVVAGCTIATNYTDIFQDPRIALWDRFLGHIHEWAGRKPKDTKCPQFLVLVYSFSLISVDLLLSEAIIYFYLQDNYVDRHSGQSLQLLQLCNILQTGFALANWSVIT